MGVRGKRTNATTPPRQGEEEEKVPAADRDVEADDNEKPPKPGDLTEGQRIALTHNWAGKIENQQAILKAKEDEAKSAKGVLRNLFKQAKAELGDNGKADIELQILLRTEDGRAALEQKVKDIAKAFEWGNVGMGQQLLLALEKCDVDIRPDDEVARNEGRIASNRGDLRQPPAHYHPGSVKYGAWLEGYQIGQDQLMKGFKPLEGLPAENPPAPPEEE